MSGDAVLKKYYEDDLVTARDYPRHAVDTAPLLFVGEATNFSNANMLAIALATLGRIETVPAVRARLTQLIDKFWDSGNNRSAKYAKQPWFDVIVAGFGGAARPEVPARMHDALVAYPAAPTIQRDVINCDAGEIAALSCLAVDGMTTIPLVVGEGSWGQHRLDDVGARVGSPRHELRVALRSVRRERRAVEPLSTRAATGSRRTGSASCSIATPRRT